MDAAFFDRCAFVAVDIQNGSRPDRMTPAAVPADWRAMGITADDVNAASAFAWDVAYPNALRVCEACRAADFPRIFLHWGFGLPGGMDLDPLIRSVMIRNHGPDPMRWSGHTSRPDSRPWAAFGVRDDEFVIAKTAQDAFISSPIAFVLANLGVRSLIFVGGHTEACLGKTAASAKRAGYRTLCVADAADNARESTRMQGIRDAGFDFVVATAELLEALEALRVDSPSRPFV